MCSPRPEAPEQNIDLCTATGITTPVARKENSAKSSMYIYSVFILWEYCLLPDSIYAEEIILWFRKWHAMRILFWPSCDRFKQVPGSAEEYKCVKKPVLQFHKGKNMSVSVFWWLRNWRESFSESTWKYDGSDLKWVGRRLCDIVLVPWDTRVSRSHGWGE